ncbi:MAG: hypothetical protein JNL58_15710 [Planctomyces sp.]|nr:hypothetical protein [Planctomyces sp.]
MLRATLIQSLLIQAVLIHTAAQASAFTFPQDESDDSLPVLPEIGSPETVTGRATLFGSSDNLTPNHQNQINQIQIGESDVTETLQEPPDLVVPEPLPFATSDPQQLFNGVTPPDLQNHNEAVNGSIDLSDDGNRSKLRESEDGTQNFVLEDWHSDPYRNYRSTVSGWTWLPGSGQEFGWLSWQGSPYLKRGSIGGITTAFNFHMLGGPISVPIPPRLFDFVLGYQHRGEISDELSFDLATSVGVFSDFEGSARDGVRFPSHAVGMLHLDHSRDVIFGVDYLDRDDIAILPVIGMSFHDFSISELRLDLVFPRPRIDYLLSESSRVYLAGYLDGGTWDIEMPDGAGNVMTYRDYRLVLGFETDDGSGSSSIWEFGYVFDRELELRSSYPDTQLKDAFMLRIVWTH